MRSRVDFGVLSGFSARKRRDAGGLCAKRRAYNRAYMRAWRGDPRHQLRERANRERAYYERKLREVLGARPVFANDCGIPMCGLCGKLPRVAEILRLRICDHARGGYVPVRIPYCGQC